ncbi:MAG TPA: GTP cyclohydrolase I FolE [Actinomycetota bacterium]|nr:GTP cyclohydrolase I FolE [Actinomycetota bacterium]
MPALQPGEGHGRSVDRVRAERAAADLLDALGVDLTGEDVADTPKRLARMYEELTTPLPFNPTTFANDAGYDEMVVVRDIRFTSLCAHHLLPFSGIAHVGYLPGERIVGLSKLARVVAHFARNLQVQERLTKQVADWIAEELKPRGVGVVLRAEHQCMTIRGVQAAGSTTVTSTMHGLLRTNPASREEFLALCGEKGR